MVPGIISIWSQLANLEVWVGVKSSLNYLDNYIFIDSLFGLQYENTMCMINCMI
jgi:hypothetical protein